jgi:hypothetical protein
VKALSILPAAPRGNSIMQNLMPTLNHLFANSRAWAKRIRSEEPEFSLSYPS